MIDLLNVIDYYQLSSERLRSFVRSSTLTLCCTFFSDSIGMEHTKYDCMWSTSMPVDRYTELLELDSSVSEIARIEMQDAVDGAGVNGHANI